jgi:hypothetical protein
LQAEARILRLNLQPVRIMTTEPDIMINGQVLSEAEAMTVRVAIQTFAISLQSDGLGSDRHGEIMTLAYLANIDQINLLMAGGKLA